MNLTDRVKPDFRPVIQRARRWIPAAILRRIEHVHIFTGDAVHAGLTRAEIIARHPEAVAFYADPHMESQEHLYRDQRHPTIILPQPNVGVYVVLHEYGHALDYVLGEASKRMEIPPVSEYAKRDRHEAFAEAFWMWCSRSYRPTVLRIAPAAAALFSSLKIAGM